MEGSTSTQTPQIAKLAAALVALQADLKPVDKSANNPFFHSSYAPLPEIMKAVQPLLAKHKLAVTQFMTNIDGQSALRTILLHESGECIEDVVPLLLAKQDPQSQGSAVTYARRYGVMAVLGLVADEDDDGNAASTPPATTASKPQASPNKPASDKQINLAYKLLEDAGYADDAIRARLAKVKSSADASELIAHLKEGNS